MPRHYVPRGTPRGGGARRLLARNGELYQRRADGESYRELATRYGISPQRAHQVVKAEKRFRVLRALGNTSAKRGLPPAGGGRTTAPSTDQMPGATRRGGFTQRVRDWTGHEILRAADEMLATVGCVEFNMDVLASTVGVAKRTLYRFAKSRESLMGAVLKGWLSELVLGEPQPAENALVGLTAVLKMLCGVADLPAPHAGAGFPCCLRTSPCPYGWMNRWQAISEIYGLAAGDETARLGEAAQALAASPIARDLLTQGRSGERYELLRMTFIGYLRNSSQ